MNAPSPADAEPRALIGWRLLAMLYDLFPVLALWLLISALFTFGYTFIGGHDPHQNVVPFSPLWWLLWLACLLVTGLYVVLSWRRGGQTLGMRPWRLKVVARSGGMPGWGQLWLRYGVAIVSVLAAGLGLWWAWMDRDRLTWHDRASGTRMVRLPKP